MKLRNVRTRTRQTVRPLRVRVKKNAFRELGQMVSIASGGRFGSAGTVDIRRAAEVGKYMIEFGANESAMAINY
jgi:hypothetical protein